MEIIWIQISFHIISPPTDLPDVSDQIPSRFQFHLQELLRFGRLTWDFLTIVLVAFDALVLPILLAWPERFRENGPVDNFYKAVEKMEKHGAVENMSYHLYP